MPDIKVLHTTRRFYPFVGGTEKQIYEIARYTEPLGIHHRVLTINRDIISHSSSVLLDHEIVEGVEIARIPAVGTHRKLIPVCSPHCLLKHFIWADIVHIHDLRFLFETALFYKYYCRNKICLSTHGFIFHSSEWVKFKQILFSSYYLLSFKYLIDHIIAVSQQDYRRLTSMQIASNKISLIENGVDFEKYAHIPLKYVKGGILYFGRLDRNKGIELLFDALSMLRTENWNLFIVGDCEKSYLFQLKHLAQIKGLDKRIKWLGKVSDQELIRELSLAHICVFPSVYEGFGITLVEAMAAGKICIANRIPAYQDIVHEDIDAILVDFKHPIETAHKVDEAMGWPQSHIVCITQRARHNARLYSWTEKKYNFTKIYQSLTKIP
jgi:alpha-1,3-mannosyltransferase